MNPTPETQEPINLLIRQVRQSGKYGRISEEVIRRIGLRQLAGQRNLKAAVDATKSKLHQIAGAYLESKPRYDVWLTDLKAASSEGEESFRATCHQIMSRAHTSTAERVETLPAFYSTLFGDLPPIRSLLDIGCGLNPLSVPWMPLAPNAIYHAYDIHTDQIEFLNAFFPLAGVSGQAHLCDAVGAPPQEQADVALLLKLLPVLEQQEKTSSLTLLRSLQAQTLIISFPTRTLCGRNKGMAANYAAHFRALVENEPWKIETFSFPTELCFRVHKHSPSL